MQPTPDTAFPTIAGLQLYHYYGCFYCERVRHAMGELGILIEERNILEQPAFRRELRDATGRSTVPVLRVEQADGSVHWMPESRDIVRYLRARFGEEDAQPQGEPEGFSLERFLLG